MAGPLTDAAVTSIGNIAADKLLGNGPFDIDAFRSKFKGTTNTNQFRMLFTPPKILQLFPISGGNLKDAASSVGVNVGVPSAVGKALEGVTVSASDIIARELSFLCYSASIPGKQITSIERRDAGPGRRIPAGYSVEPLTLSFYTTQSMPQRAIFETWIDKMTGRFPTSEDDAAEGGSDLASYDVEYYEETVTTFTLQKYSPMGQLEYTYIFEEVYPIGLQDVALSWEQQNEIVKFNVQFAYRDWRGIPIPTLELGKASLKSAINKLKKI